MDKRERDEQIGRAAHNDLQSRYSVPETWEEADQFVRDEMTLVAIAAVSRAYEIDGVDELVEAAQAVVSAYDGYEIGDGMVNLMNAIARVREARGAGTPAAGQGET